MKRVLIIGSVGVSLSDVDYTDRLTGGDGVEQVVRGCSGAAVIAARLGADVGRLDVLLVGTRSTLPIGACGFPEEGTPDTRPEDKVSAFERARDDICARAGRSSAALSAERCRVLGMRTSWEELKKQPLALMDELVGLPPQIVDQIEAGLGDLTAYERVYVDVAAGLGPLRLALFLTVAYLREAVGLGDAVRAYYAELTQADKPVWFDASGMGEVGGKVRDGAVMDVTPFFDSVSAVSAIEHVRASLDFRSLERLYARLSDQVPSQALKDLTASVQAALDLEAAQALARLEAEGSPADSDNGRKRLADDLVRRAVAACDPWRRQGAGATDRRWVTDKLAWNLDVDDLRRHAAVIDALLERGRVNDAALHIREFMGDALQMAAGTTLRWLESRREADRAVGATTRLATRKKDRKSLSEQIDLSVLDELHEAIRIANDETRNALAHAGRTNNAISAATLGEELHAAWKHLAPADRTREGTVQWLEGWPKRLLAAVSQAQPLLDEIDANKAARKAEGKPAAR